LLVAEEEEDALAFFGGFDEGVVEFELKFDGALVRKKSSRDGVMRKMLKTNGAELYRVMAKRIPQTLSKKSAVREMGVYGVKKLWRFCRTVHRRTAAWIL
jgi:hypothetical protein